MREDDTLRFARRAGGILHERDIVGRGGVVRRRLRNIGDFVHEHDVPIEAAKRGSEAVGEGEGLETV
jgi:hypothetical protein